ncbi:MAG: DUF4861 family protein [Sedimentisphaerales bacterium]|nr:DUF4861 family protein [Sedimentisphaerales bacterium]
MKKSTSLAVMLLSLSSFAFGQLLPADNSQLKTIEVKNTLDVNRNNETISVDYSRIADLKGLTPENLAVYSFETKTLIVSQILKLDGKTQVLFQSDFGPAVNKQFAIIVRPDSISPAVNELSAFTGFYPKRCDDIAWENDKMAARMYGRGLEWETISCGIDLWCKEVSRPIIEQKYSEYIDKKMSYHESRGIGGDYYKVGPTLGCGGNAIYKNGKLLMPDHNFISNKILANGPIRSVFELEYESWDADGMIVSQTMRVTTDMGSYLCKVDSIYKTQQPEELTVAAGIITRPEGGETASDAKAGWAAYWQPKESFGTIFCGIIVPGKYQVNSELACNHIMLTTKIVPGSPFTYYTGGSWDKTGQIPDINTWKKYLADLKKNIDNPLQIVVKP